jgi:hypothetical protein
MNLKYLEVLGRATNLGAARKRKIEMAFAIYISRTLPLPIEERGDEFKKSAPIVIDRIDFERTAAMHSVMNKIAELNEATSVDNEYIMKFACDLWCARARVAYPLPTAYISSAYCGNDLFDRAFNYSGFISKDNLNIFSESPNEIISLSNAFSAIA